MLQKLWRREGLKVYGKSPGAFLLEVRGEDFAIGKDLSAKAKVYLE